MIFNFGEPDPGAGNILVVGQSNTGKSTLLKTVASRSIASGAKIIYFDIDKGAFVFSGLVEGKWINLGNDSGNGLYAPVQALTSERLAEFLIILIEIENGRVSPEEKTEIFSSVNNVTMLGKEQQTISGLIPYIMDQGLKTSLQNYSRGGQYAIFDGKEDAVTFESAPLICFECKRLFESGKKSAANLAYLFLRIEELADGHPIIIIFDDASLALRNEYVEDKLLAQINNMRKKNVSFIFAIHNISDISPRLKDTLLNHCGVRIYTPNNQLSTNKHTRESYQAMGLSDAQLDLIASGKPKKEYVIQTADGRCQVIDLMIRPGSITQAITGGSNVNDIKLFEKLTIERGQDKAIKEYLHLKGEKNAC